MCQVLANISGGQEFVDSRIALVTKALDLLIDLVKEAEVIGGKRFPGACAPFDFGDACHVGRAASVEIGLGTEGGEFRGEDFARNDVRIEVLVRSHAPHLTDAGAFHADRDARYRGFPARVVAVEHVKVPSLEVGSGGS